MVVTFASLMPPFLTRSFQRRTVAPATFHSDKDRLERAAVILSGQVDALQTPRHSAGTQLGFW